MPLYVYWMTRTDFGATTSLPWPLFIPIFFVGVIAVAVVFGELRLRTGSIWPGVLMHTIGGALVNTLILDGYLRFSGHGDAFFSPVPNSVASILEELSDGRQRGHAAVGRQKSSRGHAARS
jgi:hypothetical protein